MICKLPGMLLKGCCPFAIGVYLGLILMFAAIFMTWSATWFGALLYSLETSVTIVSVTTKTLIQLYVTYQTTDINGVVTEVENAEEGTYSHGAYNIYIGYSWLLNLLQLVSPFLLITGHLWWWPGMQLFAKIPCKKCIGRLGLWVCMILTIVTLVIFTGDGVSDLILLRDTLLLVPTTDYATLEAGPGATNLLYAIPLYPVSSLILTIFFAPKGQKLIPGFEATEVGVEVEELDENGNVKKTIVLNEDVQQSGFVAVEEKASCDSLESGCSTLESEELSESKAKSIATNPEEESVEMVMEPAAKK
jgi:hypothetical protein